MADGDQGKRPIESEPADERWKGLTWRATIEGAGGGSSKGGGSKGSGSGAVEAPNDLRSIQTAQIVDLLSEGPIQGLVAYNAPTPSWWPAMAFDGVRVGNMNGTLNFSVRAWDFRYGVPGQALLAGFPAAQAETNVSTQVKYGLPIVRSITNPDADRVRLTLSVPALTNTNPKNGNIYGYAAWFNIYLQARSGGYQFLTTVKIEGKTTSKYQRAYIVYLPQGYAPWDIKVERASVNDQTTFQQSQTFWDSYTTIIDSPIPFNYSALVAWTITADQFQSIPTRVYYGDWKVVSVPSNYDAVNRIYYGAWDGSFRQAWTNNPAWVLYDVLTSRRYALGRYLDPARIDKWALYAIGVYCDGWVPNGRGSWEPRWAFDGCITEPQDAYSMINAIAGTFRGSCYWDGGTLTTVADMPLDPVGMYTNGQVIDGIFTYQGADYTARHNQILVSWQDQDNFGDTRIAIAEDQDDISARGLRPMSVDAIACTSEGRAIRYGKWILYTEKYESELVTFTVGMDGAWCKPGDIIWISDHTKAGHRRGGRIASATASSVTMDAPMEWVSAGDGPFYIVCYVPDASGNDAHLEAIQIVNTSGDARTVYLIKPFSLAPAAGTPWVISSGQLQVSTWRVNKVTGQDENTYEISALLHNPSKWTYVENNYALADPTTSAFPKVSITNLVIKDYLVELSPSSVGTRLHVGWQSNATVFDFELQPIYSTGVGITLRIRLNTTSQDNDVEEGLYRVRVTPISALGVRGAWVEKNYTVIGKSARPADVIQFKVDVVGGVGFFTWNPVADLDVKIGGYYQLRYSVSGAGGWDSSVTIIQSIPGTSSTAELPYRPGTYYIKAFDSSGYSSVDAAVITTSEADPNYVQYIRMCEDPEFAGIKVGTEIKEPEGWLWLGQTGGLWDDQIDNMDDWPTVDILEGGQAAAGQGYYSFDQVLDAGGVFQVRLTLDMVAFAMGNENDRIDARLEACDDWEDWDDTDAGIIGEVVIYISQTDEDPTLPNIRWSDWQVFVSGTYTGRAFQFYAELTAGPGQQVAVEHLCIIADLRNKADAGDDVKFVGPLMTVSFHVKFFTVPSVVVTVQDAASGDHIEITNKSRDKFQFRVLTSAGAVVADNTRTFDWHAAGY